MRPLTKKATKVRILRRMLANVEADRPMLYGVQYKNKVDGEWDSRLYDISDRHFEVLEIRVDPEENMNTEKHVQPTGEMMATPITLDFLERCIKEQFKVWELEDGDPTKQVAKMFEEGGELAGAILKRKEDEIRDGLGDVFITLVGLSLQLGMSLTECVAEAYSVVKARKGKTKDGVFVKQDDL